RQNSPGSHSASPTGALASTGDSALSAAVTGRVECSVAPAVVAPEPNTMPIPTASRTVRSARERKLSVIVRPSPKGLSRHQPSHDQQRRGGAPANLWISPCRRAEQGALSTNSGYVLHAALCCGNPARS